MLARMTCTATSFDGRQEVLDLHHPHLLLLMQTAFRFLLHNLHLPRSPWCMPALFLLCIRSVPLMDVVKFASLRTAHHSGAANIA